MDAQKKLKQYEDLIWKSFGQTDSYNKTRHRLIRIRDIMSAKQKSYTAMSAKRQFDYAVTIGIIVIQSSMKDMRQFSLTKDKKEVFDYSVDEGYVPPSPIRISDEKLLIASTSNSEPDAPLRRD